MLLQVDTWFDSDSVVVGCESTGAEDMSRLTTADDGDESIGVDECSGCTSAADLTSSDAGMYGTADGGDSSVS